MSDILKITHGHVAQRYNPDSDAIVSQEFIAGDSVEVEYANPELDTAELSEDLCNKCLNTYHSFDMKQPSKTFEVNENYRVVIPTPLLSQIIKEMISNQNLDDIIGIANYIFGLPLNIEKSNINVNINYDADTDTIHIVGEKALSIFTSLIISLYGLALVDKEGNPVEVDENLLPVKQPEVIKSEEGDIITDPVKDDEVEAELDKIKDGPEVFVFPGTVKADEPNVESIFVGVKRVLIKKNKYFITYHAEAN